MRDEENIMEKRRENIHRERADSRLSVVRRFS